MLGLGWTTAEIVTIIFVPLLSSSQMPFIDAFFTIIERIGASTFHILASYVVLYAYFEIGNHCPSFWLAMIAPHDF